MRNACISLLRFLPRLTVSLSSGAALTVVLITLIQHFFPDPTERHKDSLANLEMRQELIKPPQDPAGRLIQPLADTSASSVQPNAGTGHASEERQEPVFTGRDQKTAQKEEQAAPPSAIAELRATALQNFRHEQPAITMAVAVDTPPDRKAIEPAQPGSSNPALTAHPRAEGQAEQQPAPPIGLHISIHYQRDSSAARMDAQRLASWLMSSSFATPRLLTTEHPVAAPVVRYFFSQDAAGAALLVRTLGSKDQSWRLEDCRSWRRKPPAGTIEVWPHT